MDRTNPQLRLTFRSIYRMTTRWSCDISKHRFGCCAALSIHNTTSRVEQSRRFHYNQVSRRTEGKVWRGRHAQSLLVLGGLVERIVTMDAAPRAGDLESLLRVAAAAGEVGGPALRPAARGIHDVVNLPLRPPRLVPHRALTEEGSGSREELLRVDLTLEGGVRSFREERQGGR